MTMQQAPATHWRDLAVCAALPPAESARLFFGNNTTLLAQGRALCQTCPVRDECLAEAGRFEVGMRGREKHMAGTWGGLSARERRRRRKGSDVH